MIPVTLLVCHYWENLKFKNFQLGFSIFIPILLLISYSFKDIRELVENKSDKILCAKHRKGHFEGVLNVMNRLLSIIKSKYIFMGEKDFQQYALIKRILGKKYNIKIIGCPTIREKSKIALSTRNKLLSNSATKKASKIANKLIKLKEISRNNNLKKI